MVAKKKNTTTSKKVNVKTAKGCSAPAISVNRKEFFVTMCESHCKKNCRGKIGRWLNTSWCCRKAAARGKECLSYHDYEYDKLCS
jgi:hypothetical protein